jgi:sialate O-acetylesterase
MQIAGTNQIALRDILVGDVWVCSGQSNMTHMFNRWQERYAAEIAAADNPEIRQFYVPTKPVLAGPIEDIAGLQWKRSTPKNVLDFTVIGYFFAKKLHDRYHVPQGLIMTCVGGTKIEAWTSEEGFKDFPDLLATVGRNQDTAYVAQVNATAKAAREAASSAEADLGLAGPVPWFDPAYVPRLWKPIAIPGYWEDQGVRNLDGVVWYRREIDVPAAMAAGEVRVKLGRIQDADKLYVNGRLVGETTYEYPQRRYTIPAGGLHAGLNLFVVRIVNAHGKGGFVPDKPYQLEGAGPAIDLTGYWSYRVGEVYPPHRPTPAGISAQDQPAALFNGMIAPFTRCGIRGVLWYQGESNADHPEGYEKLLSNLIADWRNHWGLGDVPFLIAQLPNYMDVDYLPAESNWALIREAEMKSARTVPNTGLGINIDLGEWNDIHPGNKQPVGERLALQAMRISYGDHDLVASGPVFRAQEIKDGKIILSFDDVGGGLVSSNGEPLAHFAIAGADKHFQWATAVIKGDQVVVSRGDVPDPRYVRYAWADNPDFANLANRDGLPAAPFRTDR